MLTAGLTFGMLTGCGGEEKKTYDQACADLCNKMPVMAGSILDDNTKEMSEEEHEHCHHDHFKMTHPDTEWESCLEHAQKMGLGTREYELVQI